MASEFCDRRKNTLLNANQMSYKKHNVQKAMMHLEKARMYFGGYPSNPRGMERMDHAAIIRYSKLVGPRGGRHHPRNDIGPVLEPSEPTSFTFFVFASNEVNSATSQELVEYDIFNDGNGRRSLISNLIIRYHVTPVTQQHFIVLMFKNASSSWEIDPNITNPPNEPLDQRVMYESIEFIIQQARARAMEHTQSTGEVDLYLKENY